MDAPDERLLTPKEVAERLGLSAITVGNMMRAKRLPAVKLSRQWRVRQSDLDQFIRGRKPKPDDTQTTAESEQTAKSDEQAVAAGASYLLAASRIAAVPELEARRQTLLRPQPEGDSHYRWVATADLADLIAWAKAIARDAEGEGTASAAFDQAAARIAAEAVTCDDEEAGAPWQQR